jgi:hypothetical protein
MPFTSRRMPNLRIAADKQMDVVWHDFHFNQRRLRLVAYLLN